MGSLSAKVILAFSAATGVALLHSPIGRRWGQTLLRLQTSSQLSQQGAERYRYRDSNPSKGDFEGLGIPCKAACLEPLVSGS